MKHKLKICYLHIFSFFKIVWVLGRCQLIEYYLILLQISEVPVRIQFPTFLKRIIRIKCQARWVMLSNSPMKTFWRFWVLFSLEKENQGRNVTRFCLRDWQWLVFPPPPTGLLQGENNLQPLISKYWILFQTRERLHCLQLLRFKSRLIHEFEMV